MESSRFDDLVRRLSAAPTRRDALRGVAAAALASLPGRSAADVAEAGRRRKRKRNRCTEELRCGSDCCGRGRFCCFPDSDLCCADGTWCCPLATGYACCAAGESCSHPWGDDVTNVCCPSERQWHTATDEIRCCPPGTIALDGITTDDAPCCPVEKMCGTTCCGDLAPVCIDPARERCCTESGACGNECCVGGATCCGGECCFTDRCHECQGGTCVDTCNGPGDWCDRNGICQNCGEYGCGG